ncbi:MAG: hypothetical protein K8T90_14775 [Planctomycetes bacterium]|nr:hypothetical protein [Planctomycetota bacterium]
MRAILGTAVLIAVATPLGGCCTIARSMCAIEAPKTPQAATRDTPNGAVDFIISAFRRKAPTELYESLHPDFIAKEGGFSAGDFANAFNHFEADFRADGEVLAVARRAAPRAKDGVMWVKIEDAQTSVWLVFKNRPGSRVLVDDDVASEIRGAVPDLSEMVAVEGDGLRLTRPIPLQGQGDFVDPAHVRRVELYQDWLLYAVVQPKNIRFVDRLREETKGARR